MSIFRRFIKPITHLVLLGFLALTLHVPTVQAGLIGTDAIVNAHQAQQARDHVRAMLDRADVQQQLLSQGVNPGEVQARVNALTNEEAQQLATRLDQLPAGGVDALVIAAIVFFALLATDILGYTDIFPFVKKPAR